MAGVSSLALLTVLPGNRAAGQGMSRLISDLVDVKGPADVVDVTGEGRLPPVEWAALVVV